jgi:hypothetical protein
MEYLAAMMEVALNWIVSLFFPKEDWELREERRAKLSDKESPDQR